jgi:GTP:adenosylcobinamide-phosphate guanylyltransferase
VAKAYQAIILAAGRGPDDPMAKVYGVSHKCTLPVGGVPMLKRVVDTLRKSPSISAISISIEDAAIVKLAVGETTGGLAIVSSENSAPLSAITTIEKNPDFPVLITTADHALLTTEMVDYFCNQATANGADFSAGLATAEVILAAYPQSIRTFFRLGKDRVSGCNLFAVQTEKGLRILERWRYLESVRKKPWRLVAAFGPVALIRFALGTLSLESAFHTISQRLGMVIKPVLMPFAEAAIDVDKPADLKLAEKILNKGN